MTENFELTRKVARAPCTAPLVLGELGGSSDRITRQNVAANPNTPTEVLWNLGREFPAFTWISQVATAEWVQLFAVDLFRSMRSKGKIGAFAQLVQKDERLKGFMKYFQELVSL